MSAVDGAVTGRSGAQLAIDLAPDRADGLRLEHPVLVAAGGAGYGTELLAAVDGRLPSAITTRGTTLASRPGGRSARMAPLADGLIHAIGRPNPGIERVLERHADTWAAADVPIILGLCADTAEGFGEIARIVDAATGVAAIEIDLACADRGHGGRPYGIATGPAEAATVAARAATELPLIVKLTPAAPDPREVARAAAAAGADAISAIGSPAGLAIRSDRSGAALGSGYGWLSGPVVRPVGLRVVYEIAQVVRVPVIGIGGVASLSDVLDYLAAGASAVGLATAALADPALPGRLATELEAWCAARGVDALDDLIGRALPSARDRGSLRSTPERP